MSNQDFTCGTGQKLYRRAKSMIPGGTQLLSKRPEMFAPDVWPAYFSKARGTCIWDLDNHEYLDMSIMAVGAAILGYADPDVDVAVIEAVRSGVNATLNCPEEVALAEMLIELHPWAQMVRYARCGGEAMAMAIRIARAATKRDQVYFSGYHGWTDWYLAANLGDSSALDGQLMPGLAPNGVPRGLKDSAIPFSCSGIDELRQLTKGKEKQIAAFVVEPARGEEAPAGYLQKLKEYADEIGAVLIFDEITSGFRMNAGGIHLRYNVQPHLAVFAKGMANGYAMAAVIGRESVMQAVQTTFVSSTNWTERIGPVASLATIKKYIQTRTDLHIGNIGNAVKDVWSTQAKKHGLRVKVTGLPSLAAFGFDCPDSQAMNTVYVIEMLKRDILGFRQFKPSLAHTMDDVSRYSRAVDEVFGILARSPASELLKTPEAHKGFFRLTKE